MTDDATPELDRRWFGLTVSVILDTDVIDAARVQFGGDGDPFVHLDHTVTVQAGAGEPDLPTLLRRLAHHVEDDVLAIATSIGDVSALVHRAEAIIDELARLAHAAGRDDVSARPALAASVGSPVPPGDRRSGPGRRPRRPGGALGPHSGQSGDVRGGRPRGSGSPAGRRHHGGCHEANLAGRLQCSPGSTGQVVAQPGETP